MCEMCELKRFDGAVNELNNGDGNGKKLIEFRDGTRGFVVTFNRYAMGNGVHFGELITEHLVYLNSEDAPVNLEYESTPIKYCPFCGEEL